MEELEGTCVAAVESQSQQLQLLKALDGEMAAVAVLSRRFMSDDVFVARCPFRTNSFRKSLLECKDNVHCLV